MHVNNIFFQATTLLNLKIFGISWGYLLLFSVVAWTTEWRLLDNHRTLNVMATITNTLDNLPCPLGTIPAYKSGCQPIAQF